MTDRPYLLRQAPPIFGEAKNGMTVANQSGSTYPQSLSYWRIVKREKNNNNYIKLEDVHERLGAEPKQLPIVLLSDDPHENLAGFRVAFYQGELVCGAPYMARDEDDVMDVVVDLETGRPVPKSRQNDDDFDLDDDRYEVQEKIKAMRRYKRTEGGWEFSEPYDYPCHKQCPLWQAERGDGNFECKLTHTLYFQLDSDLPHSEKLFVYRATGIWAQRTLIPSLEALKDQTNGILAGLPLYLEFREEYKPTPDGPRRKVPMPAITPRFGYSEFQKKVDEEMHRRQARYELVHNKTPEGIEDIEKAGSLVGMQSREALATVAEESKGMVDGEEDDPEVRASIPVDELPEAIQEKFEKLSYSAKKEDVTTKRFLQNNDWTRDRALEELSMYLDNEIEQQEEIGGFFDD